MLRLSRAWKSIQRGARTPPRLFAFLALLLFAAGVRHKVRAGAVRGIFESMVELSDHGDLMDGFLSLPFPRMFLYGQQNASLSYLQHLADNRVRLAEMRQDWVKAAQSMRS